MRLKDKNQMITVLDTVQEMLEYIRTVKDSNQIVHYVTECMVTVERLRANINVTVHGFNDKEFVKLLNLCECLREGCNQSSLKKTLKKAVRITEDAKQSIRKDIKAKWIALFLPYKASMWTSLESLWMAADADPDCEAIVIPIPYYELDAMGRKNKLCYEGKLFPNYVPITDYTEYNIEDEQPEIICIHNPYDDINTVTRVPEQFYSSYLREHTSCLVYSSYYTRMIVDLRSRDRLYLPGMINAHKIIVESEGFKKILIDKYGYALDKLLAVGSPKIDGVVTRIRQHYEMPEEWKSKLVGRKAVFLLNTHMLYFIKWENYVEKVEGRKNFGIQYHKKILNTILDRSDCGLIWRPHPLLKTVMNRKDYGEEPYRESLQFIETMEDMIRCSSNGVIDTTADYGMAFHCTDALISTYSTLVQEYMVTGKPVLLFEKRFDKKSYQNGILDYRENYFSGISDEISLEQFVQMVLNHEDPNKEMRKRSLEEAFLNLDGTAGAKAYEQIVLGLW